MFFNGFFLVLLTLATCCLDYSESHFLEADKLGINPGPKVKPSRGEIWPKPQIRQTSDKFFIVRCNIFQFKVVGHTCDKLEQALRRYKQDLKNHERLRRIARSSYQNEQRGKLNKLISDERFEGYMDKLVVDLSSDCEDFPHLDMDEQYELRINTEDFPKQSYLFSQSIWGILRGLETWSQLVHFSPDFKALLLNSTSILDYPRFSHRGLLIDTSRHFLPMKTIFTTLDAMVMSKMNVLHWHVVDDQSFPFQSRMFPELSLKGSYSPTHVYGPQNVRDVIAYAASRGIRVIPEFDTPGHTRSWGEAYPNILTKCYSGEIPDGSLGPMNPISEETYSFMGMLLKEIKETFPDKYIHLGGDEVEFQCWTSNPELREFMNKTGATVQELEGIYVKEIIKMATNLSASYVVWQEVFDDGVVLEKDAVVHVWKGDYQKELQEITRRGYNALLSSCWYLDALRSGGDWQEFYRCDPYDSLRNPQQKRLVMGGEACMWGEFVDASNVLSRVWPRACAAAEKLWSSLAYLDYEDAARRLEEHACRMNRRKIPAQPPNGPGFCPGLNYF